MIELRYRPPGLVSFGALSVSMPLAALGLFLVLCRARATFRGEDSPRAPSITA